MAFTGPQHAKFLIAARFMESFCQRYSLDCNVACSNWYVTIKLPPQVELSSSMLSEWSDIINKYRTINYTIKFVTDHFEVKIV